jgi:hypothetical protein
MLYLGLFMMFAVMIGLFVFSSLLIGIRITTIIWLTAGVVMSIFAYVFYLLMEGTL